jgi:hypothetical protein
MVWAPRAPTDLALPPINSLHRENPKSPSLHPQKVLQAATVVDPSSRGSRSSSRHPAKEGNHNRRPSSLPCLPLEWCVSSSPLDSGSIVVARWLSSPICASYLDLVSCLHDQDLGIRWILSTMSSWLLIYHVYAISDLACSPLLVDALAK